MTEVKEIKPTRRLHRGWDERLQRQAYIFNFDISKKVRGQNRRKGVHDVMNCLASKCERNLGNLFKADFPGSLQDRHVTIFINSSNPAIVTMFFDSRIIFA